MEGEKGRKVREGMEGKKRVREEGTGGKKTVEGREGKERRKLRRGSEGRKERMKVQINK